MNLKLTYISIAALVLSFSGCSRLEGDVTMTYTKAEAFYGDIDSLRNIELIESPRSITNAVGHYLGKDYILIGERSEGIHVFDNTDLNNPVSTAFLNIPFSKEFYVENNYLYIESGYDLLKINLSDIRNPFIEARLKYAFSDEIFSNDRNEVLLGFKYSTQTDDFEIGSPEAKEIEAEGIMHVNYQEQIIPLSAVPSMFVGNNGRSKGTLNRIAISNNNIYVVGFNKLHVFRSEGNTIYKNTPINVDEGSETLYIDQDRLFIGSESMVKIYTIYNPDQPQFASDVEHVTSCDPVLADGDVAYSTLRSLVNQGCGGDENLMMVLDLRNPRRASLIREITMESPYGMSVINNLLFVGEGQNGLTIFSLENKNRPKEIQHFDDIVAYDIMPHPTEHNVIMVAFDNGIQEYQMNWNNLEVVQEMGSIRY